MYRFSKSSHIRLEECHTDLVYLMLYAIETAPFDLTILCGHRNEEDQGKAFEGGFSTLRYPRSNHNKTPSMAVDVAPYPIDWNDIDGFKAMVEHIKKCAAVLMIDITCGADWETRDYPHIQLNHK